MQAFLGGKVQIFRAADKRGTNLNFLLAAPKYSYSKKKWPREVWPNAAISYIGYFMGLIFNFLWCHRLSHTGIFKNRIIIIANVVEYILEERTAAVPLRSKKESFNSVLGFCSCGLLVRCILF